MALVQCAANPISPVVFARSLPPPVGYFLVSGTMGNIVIAAAVPFRDPVPAEAMQAAPMEAIDASCLVVIAPLRIRSAIDSAATRPITPDGIPVRGGAGAMTVPLGEVRGREI